MAEEKPITKAQQKIVSILADWTHTFRHLHFNVQPLLFIIVVNYVGICVSIQRQNMAYGNTDDDSP
jgi:hypothetical protein